MNLQLPLKKQWFEMTKAGIKTEDYREVNHYWIKRLFISAEEWMFDTLIDNITKNNFDIIDIENYYALYLKKFTTNTMTLGYPNSSDTERIIKFEHAEIEIRTGNPEWGAEPNKLYFVIKHGKRINF